MNKALARYEDVLKAKQVEKETDAKNYYVREELRVGSTC